MQVGIDLVALAQTSAPIGINPSCFNYFTNNAISSCMEGVHADCGVPSRSRATGIPMLGNLFRDNSISGINQVGAGILTDVSATPGVPVDMLVLDQNTFTNLGSGIDCDEQSVGSRTRNVLIFRNQVNLSTGASSGGSGVHFGSATSSPGLGGNSWTNLGSSTYGGVPPGPILEVPIRNLNLTDAGAASVNAALTVVNSGTSPLAWTATSDSRWLTLAASSGVIAAEDSSPAITLACSSAGLRSGTYVGTITLSGAAQTMQVSVSFTVTAPSASTAHGIAARVSGGVLP
jgi:hypothetical protein